MNIILKAKMLSRPCSTHSNEMILSSQLNIIRDELVAMKEGKYIPISLQNDYDDLLDEIYKYMLMSEAERHLRFIGFDNRVESVVAKLMSPKNC